MPRNYEQHEQQKEQTKNVRGIMSTIDLSHQNLIERFLLSPNINNDARTPRTYFEMKTERHSANRHGSRHVSMIRISCLDGSIWTRSDLDVSDCWMHAVALVALNIVDNTGQSTITSTLV